jgi:hypothetical protein
MTESQQFIPIHLSFVEADLKNRDPAIVNVVAHEAITALRGGGYTVHPVYTGTRGPVPFDVIMQVAQRVQDNKEFLIELVKLATPIVAALITWHQAYKKNNSDKTPPLTVVVNIGSASVPILPDKVHDNAWLLEQLLRADPNLPTTITSESTLAVDVQVSPLPPRDL